MIKIIYILSHVPNPVILNYKNPVSYFLTNEQGKFQLLNESPFWVGFFSLDHHVLAASDLLDLTDEFEIECWRPYGYGLKESHEECINGIKHRVFPSYMFTIPQFGTLTWSNDLFNALVEEIETRKVIINLSVGHSWFNIRLMLKLRKYTGFGLVAIHRSGGFRHFCYKNLHPWKKIFKWYYYLESKLDAYSLQFCDIYYIGARPEADYVTKKKEKIPGQFFMEGIDFDKYKVLNQNEKRILRKKLKLPIDKILLIACGNWISTDYGYQHLLKVFKEIKASPDGSDLELVMIGGYKSQDLYEVGINSGAIMIERVNKAEFIEYLEASDFFAQASFSWSFIHFGGFGTAMIEALACGLPVISGNIIHFPGSEEERQKIGMYMHDVEVLKQNIVAMKNNLSRFKDCRELAKKYYDINNTRMVLLSKYRELAMKYFGMDTQVFNTKSTVQ